jgi:hypothetical protein
LSYNVFINTQLISDEPIGFADASLKIVRGDGIDGISASFISDIQFWGDGYALLKSIAETSEPCDIINVRIEENCINGIVFDGIIYVSDIEFDSKECLAKTAIEDDSLQSRITRFASIKARFGSDKSINGVAITPYSGVTINTYPLPPNPPVNVRSFKLKESITYLLKYLTDNQANVSFNNGFNVDYDYTEYVLTCNSTGTPGSMTFEWKDIYGDTQTATATFFSTPFPADFAVEVAQTFASIGVAGDGLSAFYIDRIGIDVILRFWNVNPDLKITAVTGTPGDINGITPPGSIARSKIGTYGFQNVHMTIGACINDPAADASLFAVSWEDMRTLLSLYNVSVEYSGNDIIFYEEEDTFDSTSSASISDIDRISMSYNQPLAISALSFTQPFQSPELKENYALLKSIGYAGLECSEEDVRVAPVFNYAATFQFGAPANVGSYEDEELYVFEANSGTVARYSIRRGTSFLAYIDLASGLHPFVANNYVFKNPSGLTYEEKTVANTSVIKIKKQATFIHPLTTAQFQSIKADPKKAIIFDSEKGYVKELNYSLKTGLTEFNLLVE